MWICNRKFNARVIDLFIKCLFEPIVDGLIKSLNLFIVKNLKKIEFFTNSNKISAIILLNAQNCRFISEKINLFKNN